jgi:SPP1 family predicted phage head-tail adaptor
MSGRIPPLGTLCDRVQVQTRQSVPEAEGGTGHVFMPLATVWSRVRALSGSLAAETDARMARISHTVVMRYRADIHPGDRIIYRGRQLEVVRADDLNGRRAYLSCACVENSVAG